MQRLWCQGHVLTCLQKWTVGSDRSGGSYLSKTRESYKKKSGIITRNSLSIRGKNEGERGRESGERERNEERREAWKGER